MKLSRSLWGSWAWKPARVPRSLFVGNRFQPPWPSLSPKGQIGTVANQGREGMQRQGRASQETIVQPWGRVLVPPQGIHINNIFELFTELKPPTNGRCSILQIKGTRETHQEIPWGQIKGVQALHTPQSYQQPRPSTTAIKLLTKFSQVGHTVLRGVSPLCPPLPGKAIKLFFSSSPKTLSARFDLALVPRGRVFGMKRKTYDIVYMWNL